jgi:hypothetical protein
VSNENEPWKLEPMVNYIPFGFVSFHTTVKKAREMHARLLGTEEYKCYVNLMQESKVEGFWQSPQNRKDYTDFSASLETKLFDLAVEVLG